MQGFKDLFAVSMMPYSRVMNGEVPYDHAREWHEKQMQNSPEHFATAEMLVNLYFPELLPKFQTLRSAADRVSEIQYKLRRMIDNNENPLGLLDPFLDRIKDFHHTANELKKLICERGRQLNLLGNKDNRTPVQDSPQR